MLYRSSDIHAASGRAAKEAGVYVPLFAITLVGLIGVCALAIDAGNLYWRRLQLQSVADLAAAGGLGYRALHGWAYFQGYDRSIPSPGMNSANRLALAKVGTCDTTCLSRIDEIRTRAQEIVRVNLISRGLDPARSNINTLNGFVAFNIVTDQIDITVNYDVPLYLMSYFSFLRGCTSGHTCPIQVKTSAHIRPANLVLALDRSGSMNCLADDPTPDTPCGCRTDTTFPNCTSPGISASDRKMYALQDATFNFMSYFNPNKDRVGVTSFQTVASVDFSIHDGSNNVRPYGPSFTDFENAIMGMTPGGNTNHCDAFWQAYGDLAAARLPGNVSVPGAEPFFTLLFTDGAPTAGRFAYDDGNTPNTELWDVMQNQGLANDWLQYVVEWRNGANRWPGPSPLVYRPALGGNFYGGDPPAGVPVCGNYDPGNTPTMISAVNQYERVFDNNNDPSKRCLKSYAFHPTFFGNGALTQPVSGDNGSSQVNNALDYANQAGQPESPYWYIQKYSDCAIEASDFIRRQGGIIFTVGLGPPAYAADGATPPNVNPDPYQNPAEDFTRKDFLLRRLAYDRFHAQENGDPSFKWQGPKIIIADPNDSRFGQQVRVGYTDYKEYGDENFGDRSGTHSGTNNPNELDALFTRVAKDILLQLVE